ncbi:MAG: helix-turn-helix domain-containing protein [Nitrospirota bacterium]|nr:helix-turn-helix domain-containing protein [Nitrospirota bacterium]
MLKLKMLRIARKFFGYTQEELAEKIGTSQKYYTQIENGLSKSNPIISKLAGILNIKESFLGSSGEYIEYPFLSDFYTFCLTDKEIFELYKNISEYVCSPSEFIDIVFLLIRPSLIRVAPTLSGYPVIYFAIRDDRDTVFLFRRKIRTRRLAIANKPRNDNKEIEIRSFARVDSFRVMLHSLPGTYILESTRMISDELHKQIEDGSVSRNDIVQLFPDAKYFQGQYLAHTKIRSRR